MEKAKDYYASSVAVAFAMSLDRKIRLALLLLGVAAAVVGTVLGVGSHPFDEIGGLVSL